MMWPFIAFAVMVVMILVWLDARVGAPPKTTRFWIKPLPCGCEEFWVVRYTDRLNWKSTCVRVNVAPRPMISSLRENRREAREVLRIAWRELVKRFRRRP